VKKSVNRDRGNDLSTCQNGVREGDKEISVSNWTFVSGDVIKRPFPTHVELIGEYTSFSYLKIDSRIVEGISTS